MELKGTLHIDMKPLGRHFASAREKVDLMAELMRDVGRSAGRAGYATRVMADELRELERKRAVRYRFALLRAKVNLHYARELAKLQPPARRWPHCLAPWRWSSWSLQVASIALSSLVLVIALVLLFIVHFQGAV